MKNLLLVLLIFGVLQASAQIPANLSLTNAIDGKQIKIADLTSGKGTVVIFISNECPYDNYYIKRIKQLEIDYKEKGVALVLVNSYLNEAEQLQTMKKFAENSGYKNIPYLADKEQKLMKSLSVTKSPEAILLKNVNGKPVIFYRGAIDNNPQVENDVKESYLRNNIENLITGKPAHPAVERPTGCRIN